MRFLFTIIILLSGLLVNAQKNATLNVVGSAQLSVSPTITVVTLSINSKDSAYDKSVKKLIERVDLLTNDLEEIGFKDDQIITSTFNVDEDYEYGERGSVMVGYEAVQSIKVSFDQNKERLIEVLNKSVSSTADPSISLYFDLDNERKDKLKKELIKIAVQDAKSKGEIIAKEADYKIIGIKEINYSVRDYAYLDIPMTMQEDQADMMDIKISNIETKDLTFRDQVQIIFYVEKK